MEERIIEYLEGLANDTIEPANTTSGLCFCLSQKGLRIYGMYEIFKSWNKFSGDGLYPVPDPEGRVTPSTKYLNTYNIWVGDYGELRKELCQYLADHIKENSLLVNYEDWYDET